MCEGIGDDVRLRRIVFRLLGDNDSFQLLRGLGVQVDRVVRIEIVEIGHGCPPCSPVRLTGHIVSQDDPVCKEICDTVIHKRETESNRIFPNWSKPLTESYKLREL